MSDTDGITQWDDVEDEGVLDQSDTLDGGPVSDALDSGIVPADRWSWATRCRGTPASTAVAQARKRPPCTWSPTRTAPVTARSGDTRCRRCRGTDDPGGVGSGSDLS